MGLQVEHLELILQKNKILQDINLKVETGEIAGLLGKNDSGKTSLLSVLAGYQKPTSGTITFSEIKLTEESRRALGQIGYMPEDVYIYNRLSVFEYLYFCAQSFGLFGLSARLKIEKLLERLSLTYVYDQKTEKLSKGARQKLSFIRAVLCDPVLLLLDEPFIGQDKDSRNAMKEILVELSDHGASILIGSHLVEELGSFCHKLYLLKNGKISSEGVPNSFLSRYHHQVMAVTLLTEAVQPAMETVKPLSFVRSIMCEGRTLFVALNGGEEEQAVLLQTLIENRIPVIECKEVMPDLEKTLMPLL